MDDYCLDGDRIHAYEGYSASLFHWSDEQHEPSSLTFGFVVENREPLSARDRWQRWFD